jgi:cytochrome P450
MEWDAEVRAWRSTRFAEVLHVLTDPGFSSARLPPVNADDDADTRLIMGALARQVAFQDPPAHQKGRDALRVLFDRSRLSFRADLENDAEHLVDAVANRPAFDLMTDFAGPLAASALGRLLDLDPVQVRAWATALGRFHDGGSHTAASAAAVFRDLETKMCRHDLCTIGRLEPAEAAANAALVLFAGQPTTEYLIGSTILTAMKRPQANHVTLIEEVLRLQSPIQGTTRRVRHTVRLSGRTLAAGDRIELWLGAANRDRALHESPNASRPGRRPSHLAFGAGIHACPGAALARMTAAVALGTLDRRAPLWPAGPPIWYPNASVRGLTRLPVRWSDAT